MSCCICAFAPSNLCATENADVLKTLIGKSDVTIPRKGLHCDLNGTRTTKDGSPVFVDVKVGDFVAAYVGWAQAWQSSHVQSFTCKGKETLSCSWWYGDNPSGNNPGWQMFLNFKFARGKVLTSSLACEQVP